MNIEEYKYCETCNYYYVNYESLKKHKKTKKHQKNAMLGRKTRFITLQRGVIEDQNNRLDDKDDQIILLRRVNKACYWVSDDIVNGKLKRSREGDELFAIEDHKRRRIEEEEEEEEEEDTELEDSEEEEEEETVQASEPPTSWFGGFFKNF